MKKFCKPSLFANIGGLWVPTFESKKMRVAMCLVYEDSAMPDWINRLYRWHVPAAISPLHDKDVWDDVKTPMVQLDEDGKPVIDENGNTPFIVDDNGEVQFYYYHHAGDPKKAHWHVMIAYGNATTEKVFKNIIDDIGGVIPPLEHMQVSCPGSMFRYFGHLDDPGKAPYDMKDCILMNGFDPVNYETFKEKNEPFKTIVDEIALKKDTIRNYTQLVNYYRKKGDERLYYFVVNHTLFFTGFFKTN